jgi:nucleobase:cation symporter-1, NCS1 family
MGGTVNYLISFILFWLGSLPFIWFPVHKIRHLFTVKAFVAPTAGIALLVWVIIRAGGVGPIVKQPATAGGSKLAWGVIAGIMSAVSNFATLIVNDPDFTRFASKPSDALWPQLITIPVGFGLTSFIGIIVGSSSAVIYPSKGPTWSPLQLLGDFITDGKPGGVGSSGDRAGTFFIAAAFVLAQLGTNIAANSISAGTDLTALAPRYMSIRRGGYVCAVIGIGICPWQFLTSASKFTTYLSAYSVFLSSIAGPMICDYYIVRKGYLQIRDLYDAENGPYYSTLWHPMERLGCLSLWDHDQRCGVCWCGGYQGADGRGVHLSARLLHRFHRLSGGVLPALQVLPSARTEPDRKVV